MRVGAGTPNLPLSVIALVAIACGTAPPPAATTVVPVAAPQPTERAILQLVPLDESPSLIASADGRRFVTSSLGVLTVGDPRTARVLRHFDAMGSLRAVSPDGGHVAESDEAGVTVRSLDDGREVGRVAIEAFHPSVAVASGGARIAIIVEETLSVYDVGATAPLWTTAASEDDSDQRREHMAVAFEPSGGRVVAAAREALELFDAASGESLDEVDTQLLRTGSLVWSTDAILALGSPRESGTVVVTWTPGAEPTELDASVPRSALVARAGGDLFVAGPSGLTVAGDDERTLDVDGLVLGVAPERAFVRGDELTVTELPSGASVATLPAPGRVLDAHVDPTGHRLAVRRHDLELVDTLDGHIVAALPGAAVFGFSRDGSRLFGWNEIDGQGVLHFWSATDGAAADPPNAGPLGAILDGNGSLVAATDAAGRVAPIDPETFALGAWLDAPGTRRAARSQDGRWLLVASESELARIDLTTGARQTFAARGAPTGVALVEPGARAIVIERGEAALTVRDPSEAGVLFELPPGTSTGAVVSPDHRRLAIVAGADVWIWADGAARTLDGGRPLGLLRFEGDGSLIALARDHSVLLWARDALDAGAAPIVVHGSTNDSPSGPRLGPGGRCWITADRWRVRVRAVAADREISWTSARHGAASLGVTWGEDGVHVDGTSAALSETVAYESEDAWRRASESDRTVGLLRDACGR